MNKIVVTGRFEDEPMFSHEKMDESFFTATLLVRRMSGVIDRLPVTIPGKLMADVPTSLDTPVRVEGQVRTYNRMVDGVCRLIITLFTQSILPAEYPGTENNVELHGVICKVPIYRITPFGREICDLMLAVNRAYGKSDYIPCVTWGANALEASKLHVGDPLGVTGRLQSRVYQKLLDDGNYVDKEAIELSVFAMNQSAEAWRMVKEA